MKITYIEHSGFSVEYKDMVFIFDYYKGTLPAFEKDKKLYVFASHAHFDHFHRSIFTWASMYPDITYILSDDISAKGPKDQVIYMGPGEEKHVGGADGANGIKIKTLRSTDEGVAFFLSVGDITIYHAGDLNWWHWEEEGPLYNKFMRKNYQRAIEQIAGASIDAAFVPVDPRLSSAYYWGLDWFMKHTDTRCVFPMHMQGQYDMYDQLMKEPDTEGYRERIIHITEPGQVFETGI